MSRATSVIEINGRRYDVGRGAVVGSAKKVIDGFVRNKKATPAKKQPAKVISNESSKPSRKIYNAKQVHSRAQRSQALMRGMVNRPKTELANAAKSLIKPSVSKAVDSERERRTRASAIVKDSRVKRFGLPRAKQQSEEVRQPISAKARPIARAAVTTKAVAAPLPSMVVSASHQRLERLLDEALIKADTHKEMLKGRSRNPLDRLGRLPRWLTIVIVLCLLLLVAAFVVWRAFPQVAVKIAGKEAHVNASLPSYTPTGFSVAQPIGHANNTVTVNYQSDTNGGQKYDISQKSSSWDSSSLAANVLNGPNSQVQTSQVQGTTVYIYGSRNNATWVNNGVWYTLTNNANLSSDQILHIVQSM